MKKIKCLNRFYLIVLITSLLFLFLRCSTCPGAQNLNYARKYTAMDFMKYPYAGKECIFSKTNTIVDLGNGNFKANLNSVDKIQFTIKNDTLIYLRVSHFLYKKDPENPWYQRGDDGYEGLRSDYNKYIRHMKLYGTDIMYHSPNARVTGEYLTWDFSIVLTSGILQITAFQNLENFKN